MNKLKAFSIIAALSGIISCGSKDNSIRINQVGFYPGQEKTMTLEEYNEADIVTITDAEGAIVWEGSAERSAVSPWSGKERRIFDFSEITQTGTYTIHAGKDSASFTVSRDVLKPLADAALTAFYHQRSGMDLDPAIAGIWARKGGHPDTLVYIHASAASENRPEGTVLSSSKGWYDAGDYNKYVVNSGYSMGLMANAFRVMSLRYRYDKDDSRKFWKELEYNNDWLLTMQDPADGGVYHKLTTPSFEGFITPGECRQKRYVVQKSVTAALDFAAVCGEMGMTWAEHSARNLGMDINTRGVWERAEPGREAYEWAINNPDAFYHQNQINDMYDPDIVTGAYGDNVASDEMFWAATTLYRSVYPGDRDSYLEDVIANIPEKFTLMSWGNVAALGVFNWIEEELRIRKYGEIPASLIPNRRSAQKEEIRTKCVNMLLEYCDESIKAAENSCYNSAYGNSPEDFGWGCSSSFCDQAICFLYAYELTGDRKYVDNAFRNVNYILGQNATGYCYVTGFGWKSPMHPHSRLCETDGIEEPIPGLLVGGPNPHHNDKAEVKYHSDYPDESYEDVMPSYASNEVAINWNASLVAAITWLSYIGNELHTTN